MRAAQGLHRINGHPDRTQAVSGMAHFSGGGPSGSICKRCKHYGHRELEEKCVKFREMMGAWGANVRPATPACKYFEEKPRAQA